MTIYNTYTTKDLFRIFLNTDKSKYLTNNQIVSTFTFRSNKALLSESRSSEISLAYHIKQTIKELFPYLFNQKRLFSPLQMSRFFIILIKGIVGFIWLIATLLTTILLSPFVLASWISGMLDKKRNNNNENSSSENSNN